MVKAHRREFGSSVKIRRLADPVSLTFEPKINRLR